MPKAPGSLRAGLGSESGPLDSFNERFSPGPYTSAKGVLFPDGDISITGAHLRTRGESSSSRRPQATEEEKAKKAADRARCTILRTCKYWVLCYLWTLTYRGRESDREKVLRDVALFEKKVRRYYPLFSLIGVLEVHRGGGVNDGGFHFHFAVACFYDVSLLRRCWWEVVGEREGNVDVGERSRWRMRQTPSSIAKYLAKYVSKEFVEGSRKKGEHRYFRSQSLTVPFRRLVLLTGSLGEREARLVAWVEATSGRKVAFRWHSEDGMEFCFRTFL